jgi:type IV pilus assembly protein PilP
MRALLVLRFGLRLLLLALGGLLTACGVSTTEDLSNWMAQERSKKSPARSSVLAPQEFHADAYLLEGQLDPFSNQRFVRDVAAPAPKSSVSSEASRFALEWSGERQPLEKYPLESLEFLGTLSQQGVRVALVMADKRLHQLRTGDYVGTRRGKVLQISATEMQVRELVKDESGQLTAKTTTVPLKQGNS